MRLIERYLKHYLDWKMKKEMLEDVFPSVLEEYQQNIEHMSPLKLRARDTFWIVMKIEIALKELQTDEFRMVATRYFHPDIDEDEKACRFLGWSREHYYKHKRSALMKLEDSIGIRTFTSWEEREELYREMEAFWNEDDTVACI